MAVRREDPLLLVEVARLLRLPRRDPARQRQVALVAQQALDGEHHRHQRGRTGGLHVEARAGQVQFVGDPGGQEVLVAGDGDLGIGGGVPGRQQVVQQVGVEAGAAEDPDGAREPAGIAAGVLQGLPGAFEE
jgi:hypothetical protein